MSNNFFALVMVLATGLVFGCGALFASFDIVSFIIGGLFGIYAGIALLYSIDPKTWRYVPLFCGFLGGLIPIAIAVDQDQTISIIILVGVVGAIVGFFAPWWVKYT